MAPARSTSPHDSPQISRRGAELISPANGVASAIARASTNLYSADNSKGVVNLGVAENWLMQDWLVQHFTQEFELVPGDLHYQSVFAPNSFKEAFAGLLNRYFQPAIPVEQAHLVTGIGVTAVLEQLLYTLCNENDRVLIAKPYYPGFDRMAKQRLGIHIVGVEYLKELDPSSEGIVDCFESVYQALRDSKPQHDVKCVILCNPNNPLGFTYSKEVLIQYLKFCEKHNLHLIVDEIYAFSIYNPHGSTSTSTKPHESETTRRANCRFVSALSIDCQTESGCDPQRLHVVYGMSEDFGSCSLRAAVLITQHNSTVVNSVRSIALQMQIPRSTEVILEKLLGNATVLDWYIKEYQNNLQVAYEYAVQRLKDLKINYLESCAGHFIVIDLQDLLPSRDSDSRSLELPIEKEEALFFRLLNDFNLYLGPMLISYHNPIPGFFRLTFTTSRVSLDAGLSRLEKLLQGASNDNSQAS